MTMREKIELVYRQGRQEADLSMNTIDYPISEKEKKFLDAIAEEIIAEVEKMMKDAYIELGYSDVYGFLLIDDGDWLQFKKANGVEREAP